MRPAESKQKHRKRATCGPEDGGAWGGRGGAGSVQGGPNCVEPAGRARAERTENIPRMFVTPEVSQLDMSALNWPKPEKSWYMLVIAETPQLEMGPYVAVAEALSALYSWAAVRREAVSVNMVGGSKGGGDGGGGEGGGEHDPKPLQELYAEEKAALPAHAQ